MAPLKYIHNMMCILFSNKLVNLYDNFLCYLKSNTIKFFELIRQHSKYFAHK